MLIRRLSLHLIRLATTLRTGSGGGSEVRRVLWASKVSLLTSGLGPTLTGATAQVAQRIYSAATSLTLRLVLVMEFYFIR